MPWVGSFNCNSFKLELFLALHNFASDTFKLALYQQDANLSPGTTNYQTQGEVPPFFGYQTGGKDIVVVPPILVGSVALVEFEDVVWVNASFTARGAMCYNATLPGYPAVFVLDFGQDRIANAGNFVVEFPGPDPFGAILRIP